MNRLFALAAVGLGLTCSTVAARPPNVMGFTCGIEGGLCCGPYRSPSGGVIGPSHCKAGLGCNTETMRCERPCGSSGEVCCDGPDTVASQARFWRNARGQFVPTKSMCENSACDATTRRCVGDCGQTAGAPCCGPQPSNATATCINPSTTCKFSDTTLERGTCVSCGGLGELPCRGTCAAGLTVSGGTCGCNPAALNREAVLDNTACTKWPMRRASCWDLRGGSRQWHSIVASAPRGLSEGPVCVEGAFGLNGDILLTDLDNPRIFDTAKISGARAASGVEFLGTDHYLSVSGGEGSAVGGSVDVRNTSGPYKSLNDSLWRVPLPNRTFGWNGPESVTLISPGLRVGPAAVTVSLLDVRPPAVAPTTRNIRVALNPNVFLVPVQVFALFANEEDKAVIDTALPVENMLSVFDRVPFLPRGLSKQVITGNAGTITRAKIPLGEPAILGDTNPGQFQQITFPDDIWAQCGIQFRLVRYSQLKVPGAVAHPREGSHTALDGAVFDMQAAVAQSPDYLSDRLTVVIAPRCADAGTGAGTSTPLGQTVGITACVAYSARGTVLAHEIGHALLGRGHPTCQNPDMRNNLMCDSPTVSSVDLTPAQCKVARDKLRGSSLLGF